MWRGISLANKCLLLFGAAVLITIVAALFVPWLRMNAVVDEAEFEASRRLIVLPAAVESGSRSSESPERPDPSARSGIPMILALGEADALEDAFIRRALKRFTSRPDSVEYMEAHWDGASRGYDYARPLKSDNGMLSGMQVLRRTSSHAATQVLLNTAYLFSAGLIAGGIAVLVFYLITSRLILSPVRSLTQTAELVSEGHLNTRADITTGDEFETLAFTFNRMLEELTRSQTQLRAINASLDLKVNELAERNVSLFEAAKLKGEFLANVSHELRTPLNSIIGFAELLTEIAEREASSGDDSSRLTKRQRYIDNILSSGRSLLELINGLLEMAKVEAGRTELQIAPMNLRDTCEGLVALIRPIADKKGVTLDVEAHEDLPIVHTDAKKFQQIIFNLLSNAVKFTADTPPGSDGNAGTVTIRAERLPAGMDQTPRVRISVLDTGPGIAPQDRERIFDKFVQLETGHTRSHTGTGLGLAISRELTRLLQGEIQIESEVGRGSMFSVILPVEQDEELAAEMKLETAFRGTLAAQRPQTN